MKNKQPPFQITNKMIADVAEISELTGRLSAHDHLSNNPNLRRTNRIRTIHGSLAIEQNTLSLEQVTAVLNGKHVLAPPKDIAEVKNAYEIYERLDELDPYSVDDLLTAPVDGSGYNPQYGLLGSNKADDERVKLFPRDAMAVAEGIGKAMSQATGKQIEAMVYGDGAFKDPAGKIWELADPVVSPGYTAGLIGTPNELKLKYLADHDFGDLTGEALQKAVAEKIRQKDASVSLVGNMVSEGTTPRNLTDLIGSLCDLTSGSGDKGTPIIYIQGYFDNYTNE